MRFWFITLLALLPIGCAAIFEEQDVSSEVDNEEIAIPPTSISGTYLTCQRISSDPAISKVGCNVMIKKQSGSTHRVQIRDWTDEIYWGYEGYEDKEGSKIRLTTNKNFHAILTSNSKISVNTMLKLQVNKMEYASENVDFALASRIGSLYGFNNHENTQILTDAVKIYIDANGAFGNEPNPAAVRIVDLPVRNAYLKPDGCYLACYSRDANNSVHELGGGVFVKGMFRTQGFYRTGNNVCQPQGAVDKDVSSLTKFKELCDSLIPNCKDMECWPGGDTKGYVHI